MKLRIGQGTLLRQAVLLSLWLAMGCKQDVPKPGQGIEPAIEPSAGEKPPAPVLPAVTEAEDLPGAVADEQVDVGVHVDDEEEDKAPAANAPTAKAPRDEARAVAVKKTERKSEGEAPAPAPLGASERAMPRAAGVASLGAGVAPEAKASIAAAGAPVPRADKSESLDLLDEARRPSIQAPMPQPSPTAWPALYQPPPAPRRAAPALATRPYRPLPPLQTDWPRDARYRSNYLPGRGYLEHLRASLQTDPVQLPGAKIVVDETLQQSVALLTSWPAPARRALGLAVDQLHAALVPGGGETTLRLRLRAADARPRSRAPLRLHLVIDSSGSMKGKPWQSVCAAVREVAARLGPEDRVSIATYDTRARLLGAPVPGGPEVARLAERVCAMRPAGNTNIYEGLQIGYAQARAIYDPRSVNRVLLLSDGIATAGPRELPVITAGTVEALGSGVTTSVVGLGDEFDALLMGRIAAEGAGNYHFAREPQSVVPVLVDELAVLAEEAAQAVELRVELGSEIALVEVVGSEPLGRVEAARVRQIELAADRRLAEERGIATDRKDDREAGLRFFIPSFRLGDEHTFLVRVRVPARTAVSEADRGAPLLLARATLRYKDMLFDRNQILVAERLGQYAPSDDAAEATRVAEVDVAEARARLAFAFERASQYLHPKNAAEIRREFYNAASWLTGAAARTGLHALDVESRRVQGLAELAGGLGQRSTSKTLGVLCGLYHYGWRTSGLVLAH